MSLWSALRSSGCSQDGRSSAALNGTPVCNSGRHHQLRGSQRERPVPNYGLASVPASGGSLQKISMPIKDIIYPQGPTWFAGGEWIAFTDFMVDTFGQLGPQEFVFDTAV